MKHIEIVILVFVMAIGGWPHLYAQTWEDVTCDSTYDLGGMLIDTTRNMLFVRGYLGDGASRKGYIFHTSVETISWVSHSLPYHGDISGRGVNGTSVDSLGRLWLATENGVYLTTDDGESWTYLVSGLDDKRVQSICVSGESGVLIGTVWGGVFRLNEFTNSWEPFHEDVLGDEFVYVMYANSDLLVVSGNQKLMTSMDGGNSWATIPHFETVALGFTYLPDKHILYYAISDSIIKYNVPAKIVEKYKFSHAFPCRTRIWGDVLYFDANITSYEFLAFNVDTKDVRRIDKSEIQPGNKNFFVFDIDNDGAIYIANSNKIFRAKKPILVSTSDIPNIQTHALISSYPNPAKVRTTVTVTYTLDRQANATLVVHDMLGRRVREVLLGDAVPGVHTARIRTQNLSAGLYYFTLQSSAHATPLIGKMLLTQ